MDRENELKEAVETIFRHINGGPRGAVSAAIINHLESEHRTIEQGFFAEIKKVCAAYKDFGHDLRNESAVRFAQKVSEIEEYMPFI